ncbi:MAG TPA: histidine kinase [Streptosporangiaceae bacterium]|nr:histidine kinase [Streptosporangiaceae bacterium]
MSKGTWVSVRGGLARALLFVRSAEPRPAVSRTAIAADIALAAVASAAVLLDGGSPSRILGPTLVVLTAAPLALRRIVPLTSFWVIMAGVIAAFYGGDHHATIVTFLTVSFAAYSAVVHSRYHGLALLSMPLAALLVIALFQDTAPPIPARATPLLIFLPIMVVGNAVHLWARRAGDSTARLRQAEAEHHEATRRALERERARIASELHDVVTHNVSVMVVQAGAARKVLGEDPAEAAKALLAVESCGRAALTELRRLLGLLGPAAGAFEVSGLPGQPGASADHESGANGTAALMPQPGLDELRPLVDRVVSAGLPVELHVTGTPRDLPPGLGLAAFRVVQEALTNVIKHAGKPRTQVLLSYEPTGLVVEVADDGRPIPAAGPPPDAGVPDGAGMGLLGLRERVVLYGGEFDAGPRAGGGWLVKARMPAEPAEVPVEVTQP